MLFVAVGGRGARLGGIGNQGVGALRLDLGKATGDAARTQAALHGLLERIVAAGVENHQPQLLHRIENPHDAIERYGLIIDIDIAFQLGVDRQQVIGAIDLDAMTGVEHQRHVGASDLVGKIPDHVPHLGVADVFLGIDDVEVGLLQHVGHRGCVFRRIWQLVDMLIRRIADHQRDAFVGRRGRRACDECEENTQGPSQKAAGCA